MNKSFKWTIEVEVDESWVADGFDFKDDETASEMMNELIPSAYSHEVKARIIKAPSTKAILKAQGYQV